VAVVLGSLAVVAGPSLGVVAVVGALAGLLGHLKLSEALLAGSFALLCALGVRGLRGVGVLVATGALTWLALWLLAGQDLADVVPWVRSALEIAAGYAPALGYEGEGIAWHYGAAAVLVGLLVDQAWWAGKAVQGRAPSRLARSALMAAVVVSLWLAFKAGFTRHDEGHALVFFGLAVVVSLGLLAVGGAGHVLRVGVVTLVVALVAQGAARGVLGDIGRWPIDGEVGVAAFGRTMAMLGSDERRLAMLAEAEERLVDQYRITPGLREALGARGTAADPWDVSAVWAASGPSWDPVPVFQVYSAYTPSLDAANAENLAARPRQVLRARPYPAIDGRNPAWDSPRYQAVVYCRYEVAYETLGWLVLRPGAMDRCGRVEGAGVVRAGAGEEVPVPARDGWMTLVTIVPERSMLERVLGAVAKAPSIAVLYGLRPWRYAHGEEATRLMLNRPFAHPAFPSLPIDPFGTITLSVPATFTFELQEVGDAGGA
jgi:hypothetical protein